MSQVTEASVGQVQHVTMPKTENLVKKRMFVLVFTKFGSCGLLPHPIGCKYSQKITYSGLVTIVECRNFGFVTVTGHLCRSVELIQRVTVTGVCRIDRNGTVFILTSLISASP